MLERLDNPLLDQQAKTQRLLNRQTNGGWSGVLQDLLPKLSQVVENPSDPDQTHLTLPADSKL